MIELETETETETESKVVFDQDEEYCFTIRHSAYENLWADAIGNIYRLSKHGMVGIPVHVNNAGYAIVNVLNNKGNHTTVTAQRIVATAWLPNPHHLSDVDHIDDDKLNNRVDNLQWLSHAANLARRHTFSHPHQVLKMQDGRVVCSYHSISAASRDNGLSFSSVRGSANHQLALDKPFYFEFAQSDKQMEEA